MNFNGMYVIGGNSMEDLKNGVMAVFGNEIFENEKSEFDVVIEKYTTEEYNRADVIDWVLDYLDSVD